MTTTTQLGSISPFIMPNLSLANAFDDYLGEFIDDYDVAGLVCAYRDAINANLGGTSIEIHGDEIYADYPAPDGWQELVREAIQAVDHDSLAAQFDRTAR